VAHVLAPGPGDHVVFGEVLTFRRRPIPMHISVVERASTCPAPAARAGVRRGARARSIAYFPACWLVRRRHVSIITHQGAGTPTPARQEASTHRVAAAGRAAVGEPRRITS
jgi:hypothetical protein